MTVKTIELNAEEYSAVFAALIQSFGEMSIAVKETENIENYERGAEILAILEQVILKYTGLDATEMFDMHHSK
jgi:hypothetical protein